jgi:hypothetical protein
VRNADGMIFCSAFITKITWNLYSCTYCSMFQLKFLLLLPRRLQICERSIMAFGGQSCPSLWVLSFNRKPGLGLGLGDPRHIQHSGVRVRSCLSMASLHLCQALNNLLRPPSRGVTTECHSLFISEEIEVWQAE